MASRLALRLILLERWDNLLAQQFQAAHSGGMRHGSLARPQHQPGWPHHVEHGLELLDDSVRRPGDHLLDLLCLLIANVAKGVAQRRLLATGSDTAHVAGGALPVQWGGAQRWAGEAGRSVSPLHRPLLLCGRAVVEGTAGSML